MVLSPAVRVCPGLVGVNGAGVMLMSGDIPRGSLCASNEVSHLIEDLHARGSAVTISLVTRLQTGAILPAPRS